MRKRFWAILWLLCLCFPLFAPAEEPDWIATESLRLVQRVKTLAGSAEWRALMGGNGEVGELLDGFAASDDAVETARYNVSAAQADGLMAAGEVNLPDDLLPLARQRMIASIPTQLGSTQGAAHIAAQSIAMTGESLPLPDGWDTENLLVLLACGADWSALVTLMDTGAGVLTEQATFLNMSATDAMTLLAEMGLQPA